MGTYKLLNQLNITYENLEKSLKQKKWQEADMTTAELMLKFGDQDNSDWLNYNEINSFPCLELNKIDLLWQHYYNKKFGFDIQKRIYIETGNNLDNYEDEAYKEFGKKIGWVRDNRWIDYKEIFNFDSLENAQFGLLPLGRRLNKKQKLTVWLENDGQPRSKWFSRTKTCQVESTLTQLENLLQAVKWQEADRKTAEIILKLGDREQEKWIDKDSMDKIDCQYINTVDQLWLKYSEQKFGFSVQKRIWNNIKNINNRDEEFGKLVGWYSRDKWLRSYDLNYELEEAPEGYFPSVSRAGSLSSGWTGRVLLTPSLSKKSHCLDN